MNFYDRWIRPPIGERRLDVLEFLAVTRAVGADPRRILHDLMQKQT